MSTHIGMRCEETNDGGVEVTLSVPPHSTTALKEIVGDHLLTWLDLFALKNAGYGDMADDLGSRAQYVDLNRKCMKLKRVLWEGEAEGAEPLEEIVKDMIGHLFLLQMQLKREASRATHPSTQTPPLRSIVDLDDNARRTIGLPPTGVLCDREPSSAPALSRTPPMPAPTPIPTRPVRDSPQA